MESLQETYRAAMRGLASTVCVVAAGTPHGPRGMTATALMSLSVEPPTLAVAINRAASLNRALAPGASLTIHLLTERHGELAKAFAGGLPPHQRFAVGDWRFEADGEPLLADASAGFSCRVDQRLETSTHSLIIARVLAVRQSSGVRPLLYANGDFTRLREPAPRPAA
jgi:flavin reductase (DIM6/NTAB) family NADH-FMN oxidoreductase RutF